MKPKEHEYSSHVAYTRALEEYCVEQAAVIEKLKNCYSMVSGEMYRDVARADVAAIWKAATTDSKQILAEYRNAAYEDAAMKCEEEAKDPHNVPAAIVARRCAAAIRALKDDGYGADNPNTIDWRKPLLTKVEVL